MDLKRLFGR